MEGEIRFAVDNWRISSTIMQEYAKIRYKDDFNRRYFMKGYTENYDPSVISQGGLLTLTYDYFRIVINPLSRYFTIYMNTEAINYPTGIRLYRAKKKSCIGRLESTIPIGHEDFINNAFRSIFDNKIKIFKNLKDEFKVSNRTCKYRPADLCEMTYYGSLVIKFYNYKNLSMSFILTEHNGTLFYCLGPEHHCMYPFNQRILSQNSDHTRSIIEELRREFPSYDNSILEFILTRYIGDKKRELPINQGDGTSLGQFDDEVITYIDNSKFASEIITITEYYDRYCTAFINNVPKSARSRIDIREI